ncbi:hypothetical protein NL676_010454 [Syzygium grande]|nr:hypothetical protein NL676_010454 [Syzygium grande]
MVSVLRALLLLTFAVATIAIAPAPSTLTGVDIPREKFLNFGGPMKCWNVIEGVEGCADQFLKSLVALNVKFLPHCCKAFLGLPLNCFEWIFPFHIFGFSFGGKVNKFCNNLIGGVPHPAS